MIALSLSGAAGGLNLWVPVSLSAPYGSRGLKPPRPDPLSLGEHGALWLPADAVAAILLFLALSVTAYLLA